MERRGDPLAVMALPGDAQFVPGVSGLAVCREGLSKPL